MNYPQKQYIYYIMFNNNNNNLYYFNSWSNNNIIFDEKRHSILEYIFSWNVSSVISMFGMFDSAISFIT